MIKLNVDEILTQKGLTRYKLFNALNTISPISYTNFNNLLSNKTQSIKYEMIEKLCNILECEPNDLFKKE